MVPTFFASEALDATGLPGRVGNSGTGPSDGEAVGDPKSESDSPSPKRLSMAMMEGKTKDEIDESRRVT